MSRDIIREGLTMHSVSILGYNVPYFFSSLRIANELFGLDCDSTGVCAGPTPGFQVHSKLFPTLN